MGLSDLILIFSTSPIRVDQ